MANIFPSLRSDVWHTPGASFSPSDISGLSLWLDALNVDNFTFENTNDWAGIQNYVTQWDDLSGNAVHFTQAITAVKPYYDAANKLVKCGGAQFLSAGNKSNIGTGDFSIFLMVQAASFTNKSGILSKRVNSQNRWRVVGLANGEMYFLSEIGNINTVDVAVIDPNKAIPTGEVVALSIVVDRTTSIDCWYNNTFKTVNEITNAANDLTNTGNLNIGEEGGLYFIGDYRAILKYDGILTDADIVNLVNYFTI